MRAEIMNAARAEILKQGVRVFTMDDISHALCISKKTIYKFYRSKNELISCIIDNHVENDKAVTISTIEQEDTLPGKLNAVMNCYYDYRVPLNLVDDLMRFFPLEWKKVEELFDYKRELFISLYLEGVEAGIFNRDINTDVLMLMLDKSIKAIMNYGFLAAHDTNTMTANRMLDEMKKIIMYGIVKTD